MKNLAFFQINEFDLEFLIKNAKKYNCKNILKFFNLESIPTSSDDVNEGIDLDPWVQWVSINTGLVSKIHKIFSFGKSLNKSHLQTWEVLSKYNFSSSIWGSMNSIFNEKKNIDNYLPDPWNFSQTSFPKKYDYFLGLPRYFAQNYGSIKFNELCFQTIKFIYSLFRLNIFVDVLKEIPFFLKSILSNKKKVLVFVLFIDLISLIIIKKSLKEKKSDYLIIFLNSIAHYQHNYWGEENTEILFFNWVDKFCENMIYISSFYNNYIIANGLSQKKIKPRYITKIKKPSKFFLDLGINHLYIEPNMTAGGTFFFKNEQDKTKAFDILSNLKLKNKNFFYLKNLENKNTLYFRLDLILKEPVNKIHKNDDNPLENFEIDYSNKKELEMINNILKNLLLIRSTSVHRNQGIFLYKNMKIEEKKIKNHEIHNIIVKFFVDKN